MPTSIRIKAIAANLRKRYTQGSTHLNALGGVNPASLYATRVERERQSFSGNQEHNALPSIYQYWSNTYLRPKLEALGVSNPEQMFLNQFELAYTASASPVRQFISIGSGNCDTEVRLAVQLVERGITDFIFECFELNPALLAEGRALADSRGVASQIRTNAGDANKWIPSKQYDGVLANSTLHHFENLEGLFKGIQESLAPTGIFITSDTIGRNGHLRWPEALSIVHEFWKELPDSHRYNHLLRRQEAVYENWDCSTDGFEGIRAQDILPLLIAHFDFDFFVPFANIVDPFIDRPFGPNFDPDEAWDKHFIDRVHARDEAEMARGAIKPTHIVAAMCAGRPGKYVPSNGFTPMFCVRSPARTPRPLWPLEPMDDAIDGVARDSGHVSTTRDASLEVTTADADAFKVALQVTPAFPKAFDRLVARVTSTGFKRQHSVASVSQSTGTLTITLRAEIDPGATQIEVQLGTFPPGEMQVVACLEDGTALATATVQIAMPMVSEGSSSPLVDFSDMWWDPGEPGWGMCITQHNNGRLIAAWLQYDAAGNAIWYLLQPGSWLDERTYTGTIYQYRNTSETGEFSAGAVLGDAVGSGTLRFADTTRGVFSYEVAGEAGKKAMERMAF